MREPGTQVTKDVYRLLEIFERTKSKATFFILANVAQRYPEIVKAIQKRGHEIASHGYGHDLVYNLDSESFRYDIKKSTDIIENITGEKVLGYRAPYFSITEKSTWALDVLKDLGFTYDASIFPISRKLYGIPDCQAYPHKLKNHLWEFPASTISILGKKIPVAGGGYLRLFPVEFIKYGVDRINKAKRSAVLYLHPYELDTESLKEPFLEETMKVKFIRYSQSFKRDSVKNKINILLKLYTFTSISDWLGENDKG